MAQSELVTQQITDTIAVNLDNEYYISSVSIIPFSEKIKLGKKFLNRTDYEFSYAHAKFSFSDSLNYSILDTIYVTYESIKIALQKEYKRRKLVIQYDEGINDTIRMIKSDLNLFSSDEIFGRGMQRSGSISRGFTIGTNRDMTVSSGLRLELAGRLSKDIEIVAALTDENTPIQPEGNTERLDELDKVFIELRHKNAIGTFGDYNLNDRVGEFGNINRKLQGLKGEVLFEDINSKIAMASSRGTFHTAQFSGQDGNQGPYRLYGKNGERNIIMIAGSEKVYIDGQLMRRGENNDYVIEYANSEITFTPNRLITAASRITVDYEYTDRQYQRNYFGGNFNSKFWDNKLKIGFSYQQEGDDKDAAIDLVLNDEDIKILEEAGDDRFNAVKTGVSLAPEDSNGVRNGAYTKSDTLINEINYPYFIYNPGSDSSIYNVVFSYVGEAKGDYIRESIGHYKFIGPRRGAYSPVKFFPLPEIKRVGNILVEFNPNENINLNIEFAGSIYDQNRFSQIDNDDNNGYARNIALQLSDDSFRPFGINLGKVGISLRDRFIEDRFTTLDRINDIEFDREYNTNSSDKADERLSEATLKLQPIKELNINSKYGRLDKKDLGKSDRFRTDVLFSENKKYSVDYSFDFVKSNNSAIETNWLRHKGDAHLFWGSFKPGVRFESENKKDKTPSVDSLLAGSFKFFDIYPYVELMKFYGFDISAGFGLRDEYLPVNNELIKESSAATQNYTLNYRGIREFSTNLSLTFRDRKYTEEFKSKGFLDNETILIRSQSRFDFWKKLVDGNLYYEAATEKAAKLEKLYIQVPVGTGNYKYLGDLNGNGIADEDEFEPTLINGDFILTTVPSDELFPVIDLKTSTRWKLDFAKITEQNSILNKAIRAFSTETVVRIEENSKLEDTKQIYLLNFDHFLNDSTTIRGSNFFQQDLFLFKNSGGLSFRFRYNQRKYLSQFSGGTEKGYSNEKSVRMRFKLIKEINNQTDIVNRTDNVNAPVTAKTSRTVESTDVTTDFSYRPINNVEVGFKFSVGTLTDKYPETSTEINSNSQSLRITFSIANKGRLRVEGERNELNANIGSNFIPFEITRGFSLGKNYVWRLNFDYRIANNLQTSVSYDGRQYGSGNAIHTMRAEARAYF